MISAAAADAVVASGIFRRTNAERIPFLLNNLRLVRVSSGHTIFAQDDPSGALFLIASGKVKVTYRHPDGREAVLNVLGRTELFGEVTPFDCEPREVTATAMTEVCAVVIDRRQLLVWMSEFPEVIQQIMRLLARRTDVLTDCLVDFACEDPTYRVARRLLLLGRRFGCREGDLVRVAHDLTLNEISLFTGVTQERITTTLSDFADRGWIAFDGGCLLIVDGHGLARVSTESSCV
jgi:CRP-like cAMP-binding protein